MATAGVPCHHIQPNKSRELGGLVDQTVRVQRHTAIAAAEPASRHASELHIQRGGKRSPEGSSPPAHVVSRFVTRSREIGPVFSKIKNLGARSRKEVFPSYAECAEGVNVPRKRHFWARSARTSVLEGRSGT